MKKYYLKNLDCANCATKIQAHLQLLPYVKHISIDFSTTSMLIDTKDMDSVKSEILTIEPELVIIEAQSDSHLHTKADNYNPKRELYLLCVYCAIYIIAFYLFEIKNDLSLVGIDLSLWERHPIIFKWEWIAFGIVYLLAGWGVIKKTAIKIAQGDFFDENFLMTIATIGAFCIGALSEAAGVMLFYKIGEYLQDLSVHRSRKNIKALLEIRPDFANIIDGEQIIQVPPEKVTIGDVIVVKPGERIPLDGDIISGFSQIDTSTLTGESIPRVVDVADSVLAGTINLTGLLHISVTKPFAESSIVKILELVENATHKKAKTEMFFTTFAKIYTPIVVALALLSVTIPVLFHIKHPNSDALLPTSDVILWIKTALVFLVISCPCALVVSIPLAYFGSIGGAARKGILIKGSTYLDSLTHVKHIVFDKTGTLTKGNFRLTKTVATADYPSETLLALASQVESYSTHPIASVFADYLPAKRNQVVDYINIAGQGISATIGDQQILLGNGKLLSDRAISFTETDEYGTIVYMAINLSYVGYFVISDELKDDTATALQTLRKLGIHNLSMLTGDSLHIARALAEQLGITHYYAGLLPEDKVSKLAEMFLAKPNDQKLIFVGDGINDAPVLAMADIGITMGDIGSAAAIETADIVIMNDSLSQIPKMLKIAKKTRSIIYQNISFAMGIKLLFVVLGYMGVANMWEAVFADVGVTLLAVLNARRAAMGVRS